MKTLLLSIAIKSILVVSIFPQSDPIQKAENLIKNFPSPQGDFAFVKFNAGVN